jgi:hypothetical protein
VAVILIDIRGRRQEIGSHLEANIRDQRKGTPVRNKVNLHK